MFSRYARSRSRIMLLGVLFLGTLVALGHTAMAQSAGGGGGGGGASAYNPNPILWGLDITVIVVLLLCSLGSIALIFDAILHLRESKIAPIETTEHIRSLIDSRQLKELIDFTAADQSFVSKAMQAGIRRAHLGYGAMREALESAVSENSANLFRRIEMLNVIGNIGPLIGLLGTVLGMIEAFNALHHAGGQAKVSDLSVGIATALWHTFGGLAVAIPSLVAFGFFRMRLDKIVSRASVLSEELLESLRPADKAAATTAAAAPESGKPMARPVPRRTSTGSGDTGAGV
ncbi:MAG: MotA/TolQ/ExbB proton channel family protein [Phycisphaerae bacterium]